MTNVTDRHLGRYFGLNLCRLVAVTALVSGLAGCALNSNVSASSSNALATFASPASDSSVAVMPWQDTLFDWSPARVPVTQAELFRLEPALLEKLSDPSLRALTSAKRLDLLVSLLYGREMRRFDYSAGHSTTARETWLQRRGDCLSLTVLVYAMARLLDMNPEMQEVKVPPLIDRRGDVDYLNQHVNVLLRRSGPGQMLQGRLTSTDMVLDFEPQTGSRLRGQTLTDEGILARYYNNVAAEHLAQGRKPEAYAHFKAAILADARYGPSYGNLAILYRSAGLAREAEQLLLTAIRLSDQPDVPLHHMQRLLVEQGRAQEAALYEERLQASRTRDPYYWIGLGLQHLQEGRNQRAIDALEQAQSLSSGFSELHRLLALAYWRAGHSASARQQLALMTDIKTDPDPEGAKKLRKKFSASPP